MLNKNLYWILAGFINLGTWLYFIIDGHEDILAPLLASFVLKNQISTELFGLYVMVALLLFITSVFLLKKGFTKEGPRNTEGPFIIGILYAAFAFSYIGVIEMMRAFVVQPVFLFFIAVFIFLGIYKEKKTPPKVVKQTWQL